MDRPARRRSARSDRDLRLPDHSKSPPLSVRICRCRTGKARNTNTFSNRTPAGPRPSTLHLLTARCVPSVNLCHSANRFAPPHPPACRILPDCCLRRQAPSPCLLAPALSLVGRTVGCRALAAASSRRTGWSDRIGKEIYNEF